MMIRYEKRVGKFPSNVAEYIYDLCLDSPDTEELGEAEEFGWYCYIELEEELEVLLPNNRIDVISAAILSENEDGVFDVETFDDLDEAESKWSELIEDYESYELDIIDED